MLKLRRADTCAGCAEALPVGVEAYWDASARRVTCRPCVAIATSPPAPTGGSAGASARAEGERRRGAEQERRRAAVERRPVLGRVANFLEGPPTAGASYLKGAVGEEKLGAALDGLTARGVLTLHDRRRLRTKANIDHLVVAPTGAWVIDAKRYKGLIHRVDRGGWLRADFHLVVGTRDRTDLVNGVRKQVTDVGRVLDGIGFDVPLHGVLCFVDGEWPLLARPFAIDGVLVTWGKSLRERLVDAGPLDDARRRLVYERLASRLPPAA